MYILNYVTSFVTVGIEHMFETLFLVSKDVSILWVIIRMDLFRIGITIGRDSSVDIETRLRAGRSRF
jgi:hypothetical protein